MQSFNPRTHEGCDSIQFIRNLKTVRFNPRTHEGCDSFLTALTCICKVSIHAPTRGATGCSSIFHRTLFCFNPRTHEGCDLYFVISTLRFTCFNPRTHEGCDLPSRAALAAPTMFQSTHPRGVRLTYLIILSSKILFQSTHPRGVRLAAVVCHKLIKGVSIHAPTRGATHALDLHPIGSSRFNPRTHEGCDTSSSSN